MKQMREKRIWVTLTAGILFFGGVLPSFSSALPKFSASAATVSSTYTEYTYEDLTYTYSTDGTIQIIGCDTSISGKLEIPASIDGVAVTSVKAYAFEDCTSLREVVVPDSVTELRTGAFSGCTDLQSISIGCGVVTIDNRVFYNCINLKEITVDNANTAYCTEDNVLYNKAKTTLVHYSQGKSDASYTIPDSVTEIGNYVFYGCDSLTTVVIEDTVETIGYDAFAQCSNLTSVYIGKNVAEIGNSAFYDCGSLTAVTVDSDNENYTSADGILFNREKTTLVCYPAGKTDTAYTIPDSVTELETYAFSGCASLCSVSIGHKITKIPSCAFLDCTGLQSMTIPDGITEIGSGAFKNCTALETVSLPDSVTSIYGEAFLNTELMETQDGPVFYVGTWAVRCDTEAETAEIKDGTTGIANSAFYACDSLKSITIPSSITQINFGGSSYAFAALTAIYYDGTEAQWNSDWSNAFSSAGQTITLYFSDGTTTTMAVSALPVTSTSRHTSAELLSWSGSLQYINQTDSGTTTAATDKSTDTSTTTSTSNTDTDFLLGDVDGDGEITISDAALCLQAYANAAAGNDDGLTETQRKAAEVDGDGNVTINDASYILQYYANNAAGNAVTWEDILP